jgi:hypothetical protein
MKAYEGVEVGYTPWNLLWGELSRQPGATDASAR